MSDMQTDPAMLATLDKLRAGALPIHCVGRMVKGYAGSARIFHVDAAGRPDVADLPRVIADEFRGVPRLIDGSWGYGVTYGGDIEVMIHTTMTSPVRCEFTVLISAREHGRALLDAVDGGLVALSMVCPDRPDIPLIGMKPGADASAMVRQVVKQVRGR